MLKDICVYAMALLLVLSTLGSVARSQGDLQSDANSLQVLSASSVTAQVGNREGRNPLDQGADGCPATVISSLPYSDTGSTVGRFNNWNSAGNCAGGGGSSNAPDVIYRYDSPPGGVNVIISTCGSSFNTLLEIRTGGSCPGSVQNACADAGCAGDAELRVSLPPSTTIYIIVDGYGTESGDYVLEVREMCDVVMQQGDLIECAEAVDSTNAQLDCNGGPCNAVFGGTPSYTQIECGQTYFARAFTYTRGGVPYSDTDWYRFSIAERSAVLITVEAEFPTLVTAGNELAACADHSLGELGYTCESYSLQALNTPPGNYEFTIRPQDGAGIPTALDYRVSLMCVPIGDCVADGVLFAPGSFSGDTEGAGDDCLLEPSEDQTVIINIPWDGAWDISLCELPSDWAPRIYLTSTCCVESYDDIIDARSTGCVPLSYRPRIECVYLEAGNYFVNIEGDWIEFTSGPYVLEVESCEGCIIHNNLFAPGSITGNTCGAGVNCSLTWNTSDDNIVRITVWEEDDWTFEVVPEGNWLPRASLMGGCCADQIAVSLNGSIYCEALQPGTFYLQIEGRDAEDCGAYTLNVFKCRTRCCYGEEYLSCVDTTQTACVAMGGICDFDRTCAESPCLPVHLCPDNSVAGQVPLASDGFTWVLRESNVDGDQVHFEDFDGVFEPIAHVTFWGFNRPCVENPMPFVVEILDTSYSVVASYSDTLVGIAVESYDIGDLFEYNMVLNPPLMLSEGWVGVAGAGDPDCDFYWMRSGTGDNLELVRLDDGTYVVEFGKLAYCLGGCVPADSVSIQYNGGTSFTLGFWAPLDGEYKFHFTSSPVGVFPADFSVAGSQVVTSGHHEFSFNAGSDFQRWVVVTNCE